MRKVLITGTAGFIGFHLARLLLAEGFRSTGEVAFGERADEVYQQATKLYPTRSGTHAEHAVLLAELGRRDAAATAARRTLELDAINRREGHTDRLLPEADVDEDLQQRPAYQEGCLTDQPDLSVYDQLPDEKEEDENDIPF